MADTTGAAPEADTKRLYLDLLKRALTHTLYWPLDEFEENPYADDGAISAAVEEAIARGEIDLEDENQVRKSREEGRDWPRFAQTMVGLRRLDNIEHCVEQILADDVPGDFIETGVWRGGATIFMRGLLAASRDRDRRVYAADSFCGLPPPDKEAYPADEASLLFTADALAVTREDVERNFRLYGLLDDRVCFLEGWFKDTLPTVRDRTWALLRLDGDMYESTMDALVNLYPALSVGGFVIIDDYFDEACREAVTDYRRDNGVDDPIEPIDWASAFWRRSG
jgi:hypothetical protein